MTNPAPPTPTISIAGLGLLTPLGHSPWATFRALLEGRTTADRLADLDEGTAPLHLARGTASIPASSLTHDDPAIPLAERAAMQAMSESSLTGVDRTYIASSKGAVHVLTTPQQTNTPRPPEIATRIAALTPHGAIASALQHRLANRAALGTISIPVAACATSLVALHMATNDLREGRARTALIVAVESALTEPFVQCYKRLGVLAPTDPVGAHVCRPLDTKRAGFTLCEASAAIVLTRDPVVRSYADILSTAIGTEPHDLLRAPEDFRTLRALCEEVLDGQSAPALIQPHATGTPDNDERELQAIADVLGSRAHNTPAYASKGAIGHSMGAAGLVNIVLSCLMAKTGRTLPMPWLSSPVETPFRIDSGPAPIASGPHLIASAGFGGHTAVAAIQPSEAP